MGMMIVSAAAAWMTLATPADGHSVAPLPTATTKSEVTCDGPLAGAYLAPASSGLGVRAPLVGATVTCKVINGGKSEDVSVEFTDSDSTVGLAADHPIVLGVDKEATIATRGQISRADGSAGPATVGAGTITAALPSIRMPQNLVVLGSDSLGNADFTIIPLLGKAKVSLKVKKDAKLEVVVAGHRTGGFKSDKKGKADVAVPAPPGFTDGSLEITDKKGTTATGEINLPAAKPLFALAVLGPSDAVPSGSPFTILAAGANPAGLPAQATDFAASASPGTTLSTPIAIKPGLWRIDGVAPNADGKVTLTLGQATRVVDVKVSAVVAVAPVPAPVPTPPAAVAGTLPPEAKPAELPPTPPPEVKPAPAKVTQTAPPPVPEDEGTIRLALTIEAGYMTNTGAISSLAPGAMVQVAYRLGQFDLGGGVDLLVTSNSNNSTLSQNSVQIDSSTTTQSLQAMVGPYARYRFTDLIGVMGQAGLGISRVTQSITANNQVNSSGASTAPGFGALLGLDLDFGLAQVFVGARYAYATASNGLSGQAGGIAGLAGVGVNLGF